MNWGLIGWVAGILLTFAGIKFVFVAIKSLVNRDSMEAVLDGIGHSVSNAGKKFGSYVKKKVDKKREEQQQTPTIIIR